MIGSLNISRIILEALLFFDLEQISLPINISQIFFYHLLAWFGLVG